MTTPGLLLTVFLLQGRTQKHKKQFGHHVQIDSPAAAAVVSHKDFPKKTNFFPGKKRIMSGTCTYPYNFRPISDSSFANYLATWFVCEQHSVDHPDSRKLSLTTPATPKGAGSKFGALSFFILPSWTDTTTGQKKTSRRFRLINLGNSSNFLSPQKGGRHLMVLHS